MTDKPCIITGPHSYIGLKNCRRCGLEWHKSERKPNCPFIETPSQKIERLEDENNRLREALSFYADPRSWATSGHPQIDGDTKPILRDGGKRAQEALKGPSN